jgi:hypothetical protein
VSTTKATTHKFEEIKERKKPSARSYNSFDVGGENVIHVIFFLK